MKSIFPAKQSPHNFMKSTLNPYSAKRKKWVAAAPKAVVARHATSDGRSPASARKLNHIKQPTLTVIVYV